jgi:hypothetical protein
VDFSSDVAGVRREFDGEFAISDLQKQDAELQWIRNAVPKVSLRWRSTPYGNFNADFTFVFTDWVGDDHPASGTDQMFLLPPAPAELSHSLQAHRWKGRHLFSTIHSRESRHCKSVCAYRLSQSRD